MKSDMEFKEIAFADKNAGRIYRDYLGRVRQAIRSLSRDNQTEILLEINSHIFEGMEQNETSSTSEVDRILDVLERLGQPEVFLKPLVAEKKLDEATKSFNPIKIAKALILNIGNGISYLIFGILYLLLFGFVFLIIAKTINPEQVGFFYQPGGIFVIGRYSGATISDYQQYERLGHWFIPIMLMAATLFYFIITLSLKIKNNLQTKLL